MTVTTGDTIDVDVVGRTAWTAVTFQNSWVNFGSGYQAMEYRKVGDMVQLRGLIKSGTVSTDMFTLPTGFRPPAAIQLATAAGGGGYGAYQIFADGRVAHITGSNASFAVVATFSVTA